MRRSRVLIVLQLFCLLAAGRAAAFALWNDIRTSALLPAQTVILRAENPHGTGIVNTILYADAGVQEAPLTVVADGPSTVEATVPGPVDARRSYGFRLIRPSALDLLPVRLADGSAPARTDLTRLAIDPAGDEVFGRVNLDLVDCRIGRDSSRLYAALTNAGGGFPVNSGLTFFSYLLGINNPADADPDTVFALIHTITAAGIIEPGLYQVNGPGIGDLEKIGEITATVLAGENTLLLSCLLADLEANGVFQSWYDEADPRLDVAAFTQKITVLGGPQEADRTAGGVWHLREVVLEPDTNQLPQLSNLNVPPAGAGGVVTVVYSDTDGNCPVLAELEFDSGETYPLRPATLAYNVPVVYRSDAALPPVEGGTWSSVVAHFSDNLADVVELTQIPVGVPETHAGVQLRVAPNPSAGRANIAFTLADDQQVRLEIYDVSGRRVATLVDGILPSGVHSRNWDGRGDTGWTQPAGVYFFALRTAEERVVRQLTLLP